MGTGFSHESLDSIKVALQSLARTQSPLATPLNGTQKRGVHWVEPKLVAEVEFAEWTGENILRQAAFIALRSDKSAKEIVRETALPVDAIAPAKGTQKKSRTVKKKNITSEQKALSEKEVSSEQKVSSEKKASSKTQRSSAKTKTATVEGVRISHPERVIDPQSGTTKMQLAQFYADISQWLLPHLKGRAVSLVRAPEGIEGEKFFQKHADNMQIPNIRLLPQSLDPGHARLI